MYLEYRTANPEERGNQEGETRQQDHSQEYELRDKLLKTLTQC
jgi:hypothetical protein